MDLLQISFLLFSIALHVHPSYTKRHPKPWQYKTRKVNSLPDDHENCFCYTGGQLPTVHQLLDSQNHGQERVVIYLYKNSDSNEIKMYTPNTDKQVLIPDIPFEFGDKLVTVTTENIDTLFNKNPNKIKVYDNRFETINPAVTDSLAIGLNVGTIENILPNGDNYLSPNGNEYSTDSNIANGQNGDIDNEPQKETMNMLPESVIPNNLFPEQYWMTNNINYPYKNPQSNPVNSQAFSGNQASPDQPQTFPDIPQASSSIPQAFPSNAPTLPDNPQTYQENSQAFLDDLQPQSYNGGLDQHLVYTFQKNYESYTPHTDTTTDIKNSLSTRYVTFNVWFIQQMKRFQNIHLPKDIKSIDSSVLRFLVQKTLTENNIYVSADGVITNTNGTMIDAANLELRPLLLGEKLNHQILQKIHESITLPKNLPYLESILVTFVSPPQILGIIPLGKTYLPETSQQSLDRLTTANGSNIYTNSYGNVNSASYSTTSMGPNSVTVTETYSGPIKANTGYYAYTGGNEKSISGFYSDIYNRSLPIAYPYSFSKKEPQSGASEVTYWNSGPHSTVSKLPYLTANGNPSVNIQKLDNGRKLSGARIEHHYEPPKKNTTKGKGLSKNSSEGKTGDLKEVTTSEPFINVNSSESGRRFPLPSLNGVMKTLLYLLDDLPSRRYLKHGSNSTNDVDILNESETTNDGEALDFRIIGGNAATGSGTPLSNKGRSGYYENI